MIDIFILATQTSERIGVQSDARRHPAVLTRAISRRNNAGRGGLGAKLNLRDSWVITYKLHVHRRNNRIIHVVDVRLRFCRAAARPRLGEVRAEREVVPPQVARGRYRSIGKKRARWV